MDSSSKKAGSSKSAYALQWKNPEKIPSEQALQKVQNSEGNICCSNLHTVSRIKINVKKVQ